MKRNWGGSDNLVRRLAQRELQPAPPAGTVTSIRRFYEVIVPNTAISGVRPPPGFYVSRFTPCGRFLVSFDELSASQGVEVVLYSYRGLCSPSSRSSEKGQAGSPPQITKFEDAFEFHLRCAVTQSMDEHMLAFSLVVHADYLILATATPDARPLDDEGQWFGVSEDVTLHLMHMITGDVLDRLRIRTDSSLLAHKGSVSLWEDTLAIVARGLQIIYLIQVLPEGKFGRLRTIGPYCCEEDEVVAAVQDAAEGRWRAAHDAIANEDDRTRRETSSASSSENGRRGTRSSLPGGADDHPFAPLRAAGLVGSEEQLRPASAFLQGLKQRLLVYLYREALEKSLLSRDHAHGSTDPDLATEEGTPPLSKASEPRIRAANGGLPSHILGGLSTFYYLFNIYVELEILGATWVDGERLLVTWLPPLTGPVGRHNRGAVETALRRSAFPGGLHMVYHVESSQVEQVFDGGSAAYAQWRMATPSTTLGGSPSNMWEQYVIPGMWGRHIRAREAASSGLEGRLRDVPFLPGAQMVKSSPYLDYELYQFDDKTFTEDFVARPRPQRSIKFVARCWPERLRFKFDPDDLGVEIHGRMDTDGGQDGVEVVYLFHPTEPFVMAVLEDQETGAAQDLTFFFSET